MRTEELMRRYNLDPCDDIWFWRTRDGSNDFPLRVQRMRQTVRVCRAHGVSFGLDGRTNTMTLDEAEVYLDRRLEQYSQWEASRRNAPVFLPIPASNY